MFDKTTIISESDFAALKAYNQEIANGVSPVTAYYKTLQNASKTAVDMAEAAGRTQVSLEGVATQSNIAKVAIKGLAKVGSALAGMLVITVVTKAIETLVKAIDNYIHRVEKANEALEKSSNAFEDTISEIKDYNAELETTQDRIEELQKLVDNGSISVADEAELKLLKEQNAELERQIALKQLEKVENARDVLNNAENSLDTTVQQAIVGQGLVRPQVTLDEALLEAIDILSPDNKLQQRYADLEKKISMLEVREKNKDLSKDEEAYLSRLRGEYKSISVNMDNAKSNMESSIDVINNVVSAYKSLKDAGIELSVTEEQAYQRALDAQDAYLMYAYSIQKSEIAYKGLNSEQKRAVLQERLVEQRLSKANIDAILGSISDDDLNKYWSLDFSFLAPNRADYESAEEYGKAYAEAWLKGVESVTNEVTISSSLSLSEDQAKALSDYQSKIDSIGKVYKNPEDYDLSELMTEFTNYDWSNYANGNETLDTAMRKIGQDAYETVAKAFDDSAESQLLLEDLGKDLNETLRGRDFGWSDNLKHYNVLSGALKDIEDDVVFTTEQIQDYINEYGLSTSDFVKVDGGYQIDKSAMQSLVDKYAEAYNESLAKYREHLRSQGYDEAFIHNFFGDYDEFKSLSKEVTDTFEEIQNIYDARLADFERQANLIEVYLARAEMQGQLAVKGYYQRLYDNEGLKLEELKSQRDALEKALDATGLTGGEEFDKLQDEIDDVTIAIAESENALIEFEKAMRQVDWDIFDFNRGQAQRVMGESDFLLDLLDAKKLIDEMGEFTEEGIASVGLRSINYNGYMEESLRYAEELVELERDLANNPEDTNVINRYNEILEKQQEMILAAESEKEAIADLVRDGYEEQKNALQELIDEYTEALDAEKD